MDNVSEQDINNSLKIAFNAECIFKAGQSSGKSGSFFFFSYDHRFILKTVLVQERELLKNMLSSYVSHMRKTDNESLLARYYGLFTISTNRFG